MTRLAGGKPSALEAFENLAKVSNGAWDGVDAIEYTKRLRGAGGKPMNESASLQLLYSNRRIAAASRIRSTQMGSGEWVWSCDGNAWYSSAAEAIRRAPR